MAESLSSSNQVSAASVGASRETLVLFAGIAALFACGTVSFYIYGFRGHLPFLNDQAGYVVGRDFLSTWFFGKAAFLPNPGRFYDHAVYMHWVNAVVPADIYDHLWSYPPTMLLLAAPFGLLPYLAAFFAWTCLGLLALYLTIRGEALRTIAILFSPAALFCLISGQISFLMAAATLTALKLLDRRPIVAGLLISLCTIRPQMGLLWPVLLIASRRWRVLAAAASGTLLLIFVTSLIFGFDVWRDYLTIGLPYEISDIKSTYGVLAPWSPTITTALIMSGAASAAASVVQVAFTIVAVVFVVGGCAQGPMTELRIALFLACSVFAAPYFLAHDLVTLSAAVVALAAVPATRQQEDVALKAIYLLPMFQMVAGLAHIPGVALIPVWFAFWALRRLRSMPQVLEPLAAP